MNPVFFLWPTGLCCRPCLTSIPEGEHPPVAGCFAEWVRCFLCRVSGNQNFAKANNSISKKKISREIGVLRLS